MSNKSEMCAMIPQQLLNNSRQSKLGCGDHEPFVLVVVGGVGLNLLCLIAGSVTDRTGVTIHKISINLNGLMFSRLASKDMAGEFLVLHSTFKRLI